MTKENKPPTTQSPAAPGCGCALDFLKIEVSKHGTFIIHPLIDAANESAGNQGCRFIEMDDIFDFFFTQAGHFLVNASDKQIIFMTASGQQTGLGAGTGEERVEPDGGTDAQCHRRAEELGPREAESGAGIADGTRECRRCGPEASCALCPRLRNRLHQWRRNR